MKKARIMYCIRLVGNSYYIEHSKTAIGSSVKLDAARKYETVKDAETAALLFTLAHAQWMRRVKIVKVKDITIQKVVCLNPDEKRSNDRRYEMVTFPHWIVA